MCNVGHGVRKWPKLSTWIFTPKINIWIYLNVDFTTRAGNFREREFAETFREFPRNSVPGNFKLDTGWPKLRSGFGRIVMCSVMLWRIFRENPIQGVPTSFGQEEFSKKILKSHESLFTFFTLTNFLTKNFKTLISRIWGFLSNSFHPKRVVTPCSM